MALSYKALFFSAGLTTTGVKSLTGFGFQPKVVRITMNGRTDTVDASGLANIRLSIGCAATATDRGVCAFSSLNAAAAADVGSRMAAGLVMETDGAAAEIGFADFSAFVSDGVEINVTNAFTADFRLLVECWGGTDITNVRGAVKFNWGDATGNVTFGSFGFDPGADSYFFFWGAGHANAALPTIEEDAYQPCVGIARSASPIQQGVCMYNHDDNSTTADVDEYTRGDECLATMAQAGAAVTNRRATFVGSASDGFTINVLEATAVQRHSFCMCIKGGSHHIGSLLTQTDTTTDIVESGFGFAPVGVSFFSISQPEPAAGTAVSDGKLSIGCATSTTDEKCLSIASNNGALNMEENTAIEHDAVYARITDTTGAIEGLMRMQSMPDSDGFTCRMDDADAAQEFVIFSAHGNTPAAPSTTGIGWFGAGWF